MTNRFILGGATLGEVPLDATTTDFEPDKWYSAWRDPVRIRQGLRTNLQQFTAFVKAAPFTETVFEPGWHYGWSIPVRIKPGLWAAHQVAQVYWNPDTPPPIIPNITGILTAIETADTALFGGFSFNAPVMGIVGVIEDADPPSTAAPVAAVASISVAIRMI